VRGVCARGLPPEEFPARLPGAHGAVHAACLIDREGPAFHRWPWSLAIAVLAAVPSCISTKPKPLERPCRDP